MYRFLYRAQQVSGFKYACYERFDLSKMKSSAILTAATSIRVSNQEDAVPITLTLLLFRLLRKKKELVKSWDPATLHIGTPLVRPTSFEGFARPRRGRVSWIPDNGKNLVPRRTIGGRRPFSRERIDFSTLRRRLRSRCISIPIYPSVSPPSPLLLASSHFLLSLPSRLLFLLFHDFLLSPLPSRCSYERRRIFFFAPSPPFSHAKSLRSPVFYSKFREPRCNQDCAGFVNFGRSWLSETIWSEKRGK